VCIYKAISLASKDKGVLIKIRSTMATIQIIGRGDTRMQHLREQVAQALAESALRGEVEEVSEFNRVLASGVLRTPALMVDGHILVEGIVPSVEELKTLLNDHQLLTSKLYRMKRILVGTDLSPASENAVVFACQLARLLDANVEVVYIMDSIFEGTKASPASFLASYRKTMKEELDAFIRRVAKQGGAECIPDGELESEEKAPGASGPRMRARIAFGFPENVLCDLSERADLLIMGTTGRGSLVRKLFGSVSIEVSKKAKAPVLLVPPQAIYVGFRHLLYASDFESANPEAIAETLAFARRLGGQVYFVHVSRPGETNSETLEERLRKINSEVAGASHPFLFSRITGDDVVEALHEYAFDHRIDLFVFVTHKRSFWAELLHHSITREMLLHTSTPVLVIHTDEGESAV